MTYPIIVVGGSMGGLRTAESLRRAGDTGDIEIFGEELHAPYNRPPLSKEVLAAEVNHEAVAFPLREHIADVQWNLGNPIVSADLVNNSVTDSTGKVHKYSYLVVATGVRSRRIPSNRVELTGRHVIRTLDDAIALRPELTPGTKVAVAGAGFIGCEAAATARQLGCEVTVIGDLAHPMERPLGTEFAAELQRRHEAQGITFRMSSTVSEILGDDRVTGVALGDGSIVDCEVLIESVGSIPNTDWLIGNDVNIDNGLLVDGTLRAIRADGEVWPNVFAVGDVARFPNVIFDDEPRRIEHWNIPTETAKRVAAVIHSIETGDNTADVLASQFRPTPSFWSDQFDNHMLAFGSLGLADEAKLIDGELAGEFVFGYFRQGQLVGVCGIGMRRVVQSFREQISGSTEG